MRLSVRSILLSAALVAGISAAQAQNYPERTITMIVPFAAGGTTDIVARLMGNHMSKTLGQQIVVENVAGAGGTTGVTRVAKATPDGYTLLMGNLGTQAASVGLYPNLAYDPRKDFEFIMSTGGTPMLVVVNAKSDIKDFRQFMDYVKKNGAKVNYGTGGVGATSHLTCLYLDSLLGVKPQHVPYRGSGPALVALMGGELDYVCDQTVGVASQIKAGQVRGLVVAVPDRVPSMKDIPTSKEAGLPEFQVSGWNAMFAPKGTPKAVVDKLNAAAQTALKDPAIKERMLDLGMSLPTEAEMTSAWLQKHVASEVDKWVPIIKKAGIEVK
jgi:tripartite-type tricarboxylate transporter receptor subunit TctC